MIFEEPLPCHLSLRKCQPGEARAPLLPVAREYGVCGAAKGQQRPGGPRSICCPQDVCAWPLEPQGSPETNQSFCSMLWLVHSVVQQAFIMCLLHGKTMGDSAFLPNFIWPLAMATSPLHCPELLPASILQNSPFSGLSLLN